MCSAEERRAAAERLEQERQQAMAAARPCTDILLEGQQQGDHQHGLIGMYELMEGKEVNGRGVWQMAGGQEYSMYYASNKEQYISNREDMEAGKAAGWMKVASTAHTPDQVTKTWQVGPSSHGGKGWLDVPKVRAHMCSAEERRAAAERPEQERQQAMAAARQCTDFLLEGQQQGDHQHGLMGMYELMEGKEVNGRGGWQMAGGHEVFMYYHSSNKEWWIGGREAMEAGEALGFVYVASIAFTPDQVTKTSQVWDDDNTGWVDAPKVICTQVRCGGEACSSREAGAGAESGDGGGQGSV
jgi:hypothetical protein